MSAPGPLPLSAPQPDDVTAPFWAGCNEQRLLIQRCTHCGRHRHLPAALCPHCRSAESDWTQSDGAGQIFTYTVVHHAAHPDLVDRLPYTIVVVELADCGGVLVTSNLVGTDGRGFAVGDAVTLQWAQSIHGNWLYQFALDA
jgi:uncharacterized OB-fold protein